MSQVSLMESIAHLNNRIGEQEMEIANLRCESDGLRQHVTELSDENRQLKSLLQQTDRLVQATHPAVVQPPLSPKMERLFALGEND